MISYAGSIVGSTQGSDASIAAWIAGNIQPQDIFPSARIWWPGTLSDGPVFDQTIPPWRPVRINTLFWPTGASRFAQAHVVVDDVTLERIRAVVYANQSYTSHPFVIDDGFYATPLRTNLWMLPARPLSTAALPNAGNSLWLISLVDDRYFWWETSLQYPVNEGVTPWLEVYSNIGAALGVGIEVDPINSAYLMPPVEFMVSYRPAPIVLDQVAWNLGQRIVRALHGTVKAQNYTTAAANTRLQLALHGGRQRAGGLLALP